MQPSISAEHSPNLVKLTCEPITATAFAPFGTLIEATEDGEPFGPQDAVLDLAKGTPRFYIMRLPQRERIIRRITHHRNVTQVLASVGAHAWQLVVAPAPSPDNIDALPELEAIRAFEIPGTVAVMLFRGTWHAGPYFLGDEASFFNLELSDTNIVDHHTCKLDEHFALAYQLSP